VGVGVGIASSWLKIPSGKAAAGIALGKVLADFTRINWPALKMTMPAELVMLMLPDIT
jgi:hypothetical protein